MGKHKRTKIKRFAFLLLLCFLFVSWDDLYANAIIRTIHIVGSLNNDIVQTLLSQKQKGIAVIIHHHIDEAIHNIKKGDALLILSNEYPQRRVKTDQYLYDLLRRKNVKALIEYPSYIPGILTGNIVKANKERVVISSNFFDHRLDSLNILSANTLHYIEIKSPISSPYIVLAKVAGFESTIYGLPPKRVPLLFQIKHYPILVATTKLSNFVSSRYAPQKEWEIVWEKLLESLFNNHITLNLKYKYDVSTSYTRNEKLPKNFQRVSIARGINWYKNARMLISLSYNDTIRHLIKSGIEHIKWSKNIPIGNGSKGTCECIFSQIDENGDQPIGIITRGDCVSETAMAFATAGRVLHNPKYYNITQNLLDFYLFHSIVDKNEYADPTHGAYGLIPWGISNYAWYRASYGDDNARLILSTIVSSAILKTDKWNKPILKSLLALLRTTGVNGFRGDRIDLPDFSKNGWKYYFQRNIINLSPHFEAYLWACFLWAYTKTGDKLFFERAERGIKIMMNNYPENWIWTNGMAQEKARMLLPLSWLVRISPTKENKKMLMRIVNDILKLQDKSGAIREEIGKIEKGTCPPPQSNEAYGTNEASLITKNGDPICDLLYTTNFAFLGLHEASYTLKDPKIKKAENLLANFLCRIQVKSKLHCEIDGGWMRAFDFKRFEHWGSNADVGWGAWAIESGWTQGWIVSILALREMHKSIWDLTNHSIINKYYSILKMEMFK